MTAIKESSHAQVAYLLLGSNLGDRQLHLRTAIAMLATQVGAIVAESSVYETAAWGKTDQPGFLNQAVAVTTTATPLTLLRSLLAIELQMGRVRKEKWGQRLIDIDLILFGNEIINTAELQLPHPEMQNRKFVLAPLNEIAANIIHPILKQKISQILSTLNDDLAVCKI